jgi:hypothetical protein
VFCVLDREAESTPDSSTNKPDLNDINVETIVEIFWSSNTHIKIQSLA